MTITHSKVSAIPDGGNAALVQPSDWNAVHVVSISNADVHAAAAIAQSKLDIASAASGVTGLLTGADWDTFNSKQDALTLPLSSANGGTGVNNAGTITNASNTTITGGGTVALGGFTLTVPATGTAALLATANVFTATQEISGTKPQLTFTDTTGSATSGAIAVDGNSMLVGTPAQIASGAALMELQLASANVNFYGSLNAINAAGNPRFDFVPASGVINFKNSLGNTVIHFGTQGTDHSYFNVPFGTNLGVGITSPGAKLHVVAETTTTNVVQEVGRIEARVSTSSTGSAAGFGSGLTFYAETATDGTNQLQGRVTTAWVTATNASRAAKMSLSAYDTAERLGMVIEASGSAAKIGLYSATPVIRATTSVAEATFVENAGGTAVNVDSTFGGYTLQQVVQALQDIGILT
jgi:hypothetical protein